MDLSPTLMMLLVIAFYLISSVQILSERNACVIFTTRRVARFRIR